MGSRKKIGVERIQKNTCKRCGSPTYGNGCESCYEDRRWESRHPLLRVHYGSLIQPPRFESDPPKITPITDEKREYNRLRWQAHGKAQKAVRKEAM